MPRARSRPSDPVGIEGIFTAARAEPNFMMDPLPYAFSICETASSSAFAFSLLVP